MQTKSPQRILVACEYSGVVRNAFLARGHDAWSCDLLASDDGSNRHIVGDARELLDDGWDYLIVAHPPCTRLCNSGVCWLSKPPKGKTKTDMQRELNEGAALFSDFWNCDIPRKCIENPIMHKYAKAKIRNFEKHSQIVQPWMHGHPETKATCLWLQNLPKLTETNNVKAEMEKLPVNQQQRLHYLPPGPDRWKLRSTTFAGIANAFADQWGELPSLENQREVA